MKQEHKGLLAIVLSAVVFILWYTVFSPTPSPEQAVDQQQPEAQEATQTAEQTTTETKAAPENPALLDERAVPEKISVLENDLIIAEFTNHGAVPTSWLLKKYKQQHPGSEKTKKLEPVNLAFLEPGEKPALNLTFQDANFQIPDRPKYETVRTAADELVYKWSSKEVEIVKTIKLPPNSYLADIEVLVKNKTNKVISERPLLSWSGVYLPNKSSGFFSMFKQPPVTNKNPVYYLNGSVERESNVSKIPLEEDFTGTVYWAGLEDRYFLSAIIPRDQSSQTSAEIGAKDISNIQGGRKVYAGAALANSSVPPNSQVVHKFSVYAGPKEINQLKAVGVRLDESIDYGWFTIIAIPILYLLKFFHSVVHNYGVAIILLTIFIKLLLHPINKKSLKSMKQMQKLQPRLKELQKKFAGDKTKLNTETMQLFKANKVNPMGGCLPMLLQFPIYIALYKVLWSSIELYRAPFFWIYKDLSAPDPYYITPILLGIGMVLQQKIMPSASADPAQQKMMMIMPVMFAVFMLFLPVGLVIYILVNTTMSVTQQWMYNHDIHFRDVIRGKIKYQKS
ncbi:MAG: membrane protein insertase YidC [Pseudomonadota bacterium]